MKEPLSIVIFGSSNDQHVVWLKCLLLKCGIYNFIDGQLDVRICPDPLKDRRVGLFIVSRDCVSPHEMEGICTEARRLAVSVLSL